MKEVFYIEVTDTYGGEANYCWVKRFKVSASTARGAMRKVANHMGYIGGVRKGWDWGDSQRWDWRRAAVCAFVEYYDLREWYDDERKMFVESI